MTEIDKELMINAPVEKIFTFVIKPSNLPRVWPSLIEIRNEQSLSNGGLSAEWVYKMAGINFAGKAKCTEVVPNKWFSVKIEGKIDCIITWTFRAKDNMHTKVTITLDYKAHFPLSNRLAENLIVKMNEHESELVLTNLREFLEKS